jgi:hypothetical protein
MVGACLEVEQRAYNSIYGIEKVCFFSSIFIIDEQIVVSHEDNIFVALV